MLILTLVKIIYYIKTPTVTLNSNQFSMDFLVCQWVCRIVMPNNNIVFWPFTNYHMCPIIYIVYDLSTY